MYSRSLSRKGGGKQIMTGQKRFELADGYSISRVINGCWQLSEGHTITGSLDFGDIMKAFHLLAESGFTTFDCGDIYTGVEEFLGRFVTELKGGHGLSADQIQIHTKYVPDLSMLDQVDFRYTEKIIDRSLKRLCVDRLDMVQFHWWDYDTKGCLQTAQDLVRLRDKGKIRLVSVTNFDTAHLKELVDSGIPVTTSQTQYSLFDRRPEKGYLDFCRGANIPLLCYGTLSGGYLSEKYAGRDITNAVTRSQVKYLQVIEDSLGVQGHQKLLSLLGDIACTHNVSIPHVAVRYILQQEGVAAAIVGVRNSRHVADNEKIFSFELTDEEVTKIRGFISAYPTVSGEPFEEERTVGSKYRNIMKMNLNEEKS